MKIYNDKDIKIIDENLSIIQKKGEREKALRNDPTIDEYKKVIKVIIEFIKNKKRIIYGGMCWNELLKNKTNNKVFFYDEYDLSDYEFYSFEPLVDLKELCDILHNKGFKKVEGVDAFHEETYTIRVNYMPYCDITYMPKIIYNKLKPIKINGLNYTPFNFLLIDIFRMFNDPLDSFWRLEKNGKRALLLFKYYDLQINDKFTKIKYNTNILDYIRKDIIINSNFIVIGYYAIDYYRYISTNENKELYTPYYEIITDTLDNNVDKINDQLTKKFGDKIRKEEYHPYFQFFDKKFVFYYENNIILIVYGNNEKCVPYKRLEEKKINIGSYNIVLMYLLINSNYYYNQNNKIEKQNTDFFIKSLITYRNNFLTKNNKSPLDNTPFEEFILQCLGQNIPSDKKFFMQIDQTNKEFNRKIRIRYKAETPKGDFSKLKFANSSGNKKDNKQKKE
tara:strand:+ start:6387 stop:7733 length:1347 start_codon:yes stop_codon:yes gene_type:complete